MIYLRDDGKPMFTFTARIHATGFAAAATARGDLRGLGEVKLSPTPVLADMRLFPQQRSLIVVAVLTAGCMASHAVAPDATIDANGSWSEVDVAPGFGGTQFTLSVSGGAVSGTGTWSGEAICGGGVSVAGIARGDSLHLDLKFFRCEPVSDTGVFAPEHLDAALTTRVDFVGRITRPDGSSEQVHFAKEAAVR